MSTQLRVCTLFCILLAVSCASYSGSAVPLDSSDIRAQRGWHMVGGVPIIKQKTNTDCGAAAAAMVINYWGVPVSRRDLVREHRARSDRQFISAAELRSFARQRGLYAFLFKGRREDIAEQIARGRPLIVGLAKPYDNKAVLLHYEVVVGYNPVRDWVATIDPGRGLQRNSWTEFSKEWRPTANLSLLVLPSS